MALHKGLLHSTELIGLFDPFDCRDLSTIGLHCKHQTGLHNLSVNIDRTRAASAFFTTVTWPRQAGVQAQEIREQQTRFNSAGD